jgi:hypothetical protein
MNRPSTSMRPFPAADRDREQAFGESSAIALMNLSKVLGSTRRYHDALGTELRALAILQRLGPTADRLVVKALDRTVFLCMKAGRLIDAELFCQQALALATQVYGPEHPSVARILLQDAAVLRGLRRNAEAGRITKSARAILQRASANETVDILTLTPSAPYTSKN